MLHIGKENNRCFAQYGKIGKKYYYTCGDKGAETKATEKANKQAPSIEKFIRNYWSMKKDF
ncbi:hypothetical protein ES708_15448 [subsurface metagenome]